MLLSTLPADTISRSASWGLTHPLQRRRTARLGTIGWITIVLLLETGALAAWAVSLVTRSGRQAESDVLTIAAFVGAGVVWSLAAHGRDLHHPGARDILPRTMVALSLGLVAVTSGIISGDRDTGMFAGRLFLAALFILTGRSIWSAWFSFAVTRDQNMARVLVVAETPYAARCAAARLERATNGCRAGVASIAVGRDCTLGERGSAHLTCSIGSIEDAIRTGSFDHVLIVANAIDHLSTGGSGLSPATSALVERLAQLSVNVTLLNGAHPLTLAPLALNRQGRVAGVQLLTKPLQPLHAALKRAEDLILTTILLLAASPAMVLLVILIKLESPGPALFSQDRRGFHDRVFRIWKFRSMYDALNNDAGLMQTVRHDRRVTRVGWLMRRTSLDELPQFFNVLVGDMSLVGPRPHAVGMRVEGRDMDDLIGAYSARHRTKPGITGWAQVNGCRGEIRTAEKLAQRLTLDCFYIANWSLRLDLKIILRTATTLVFDRQAY